MIPFLLNERCGLCGSTFKISEISLLSVSNVSVLLALLHLSWEQGAYDSRICLTVIDITEASGPPGAMILAPDYVILVAEGAHHMHMSTFDLPLDMPDTTKPLLFSNAINYGPNPTPS
jgi:hypothetical protein